MTCFTLSYGIVVCVDILVVDMFQLLLRHFITFE